jgi:2-oxo-4-hydroxy-4-carboxy-5-ureidoimidazoline decarboxylase
MNEGARPRLEMPEVNALDRGAFAAALGSICENAGWIVERSWESRPFASVAALHRAVMDVIQALPREMQIDFLRGHPDLAGTAATAGKMTEHSKLEQAGAGLRRLSPEEFARFDRLNRAYRERFGFPCVIAVRKHTKDSILAAFERRLANDESEELETGLAEIGDIIGFRLASLIADATAQPSPAETATEPSPVETAMDERALSIHVLDTCNGRSGAGMRVTLSALDASGPARLLKTAVTNPGGRTDEPLLAGAAFPAGRYELVFHTAAYFAALGTPLASPPFLDDVPIRFAVADDAAHYHIPLLVTPWSYATYRGG